MGRAGPAGNDGVARAQGVLMRMLQYDAAKQAAIFHQQRWTCKICLEEVRFCHMAQSTLLDALLLSHVGAGALHCLAVCRRKGIFLYQGHLLCTLYCFI